MSTLHIEVPEDLLQAIGEEHARSLALEALLVRLYDLGELSTGRAAEILGIARRDFLDLLGEYGISEFDDAMNITSEAQLG